MGGMGGAHIAVADDAAVIYYNPAGLARIEGRSVTSLYTSLHGGAAGYMALGYAQKNVGGGDSSGSMLRGGLKRLMNLQT